MFALYVCTHIQTQLSIYGGEPVYGNTSLSEYTIFDVYKKIKKMTVTQSKENKELLRPTDIVHRCIL